LKFILFVEGVTEKKALPEFLKRWIDPRVAQPVGIKIVRFEGWRDYVDEIAKKVKLNLSGKSGTEVIAAIGLLDLYGPTFYPKGLVTSEQRYSWAKKWLETKVDHGQFHQHFAVHETEAWLLADPDILPLEVRRSLPRKSRQPEQVNFNEPPAKLLERLYRQTLRETYKKVIDGYDLFGRLNPSTAFEKCPHLAAMLNDMLLMANDAGLGAGRRT
jgi:hypothetical protein